MFSYIHRQQALPKGQEPVRKIKKRRKLKQQNISTHQSRLEKGSRH